jgi:hypothetical protein
MSEWPTIREQSADQRAAGSLARIDPQPCLHQLASVSVPVVLMSAEPDNGFHGRAIDYFGHVCLNSASNW